MPSKKKPKTRNTWFKGVSKPLLVAVLFGVLGVGYFLYQSFAATTTVKYWGTLTEKNQTASYSLTVGAGRMDIVFSNSTADLTLVVKNSTNTVVGSVKSIGRTDVKLAVDVQPGTYTLSLVPPNIFNGKKGYKIAVTYPLQDLGKPSAVITSPYAVDTVSGIVNFSADARDDVGVSKVEFYVDDQQVGVDSEAPYTVKWDTTKASNAQHQLLVKSYDTSLNMATATSTATVYNKPALTSRFPGDPNPMVSGKAYWGAGLGGNADPARHEDPTGVSLSIRRTFWRWDQAVNTADSSSMYSTIKNDLSSNRLPFVSIKPPVLSTGSAWQAVADGGYDAEIDAIVKKLNSYGKPVWLVVHHEPEGGGSSGNTPDDPGGPSAWRAMQTKFRQRLNATNSNTHVAFMPILMAYTWNSASGRNPEDWWVPGIWDAYGVDHYIYTESATSVADAKAFLPFVSWIEQKGLPFAVGEWGNRGVDTAAANEMQAFWDWSFNNSKDMIAYTYFDSGLNSPDGSWELVGEPLTKFQAILKSDTRVQRINDLAP